MDVLVTLPPFIQQADKQGSLDTTTVADAAALPENAKAPGGRYVVLADNYFTMIRGDSVTPKAQTWSDLLDPRFKQKIQYSTPGQAGDGTALLLLLRHVMGDQQALDYLARLQTNNVGPSASTGKLGPKVSKGELAVANSDVQMALASITKDKAAYETFLPADATGKRSTLALPYFMGKAANAPHAENAQKLIDFLMSADVQRTLSDEAVRRLGAHRRHGERAELRCDPEVDRRSRDLAAGLGGRQR
ncbi:2-aminoethylphosphonate ABC transporter substrate-binding protein [Gordonia neofelifaecis NRRL B-59395]|uniref:2-aminoethylphosphonate ABC transporter substrate-binding protein n=1 Tax=Gordonia neofelifaecis NRRL B-59395 TaxID=644548 RepID=F1YG41_9ACTN|nr:extracellular solute-binding protein [Gordonia neofelifaecis]EGD56164.1 2-aminoethylphosphonate ABC transporter substrate-binding protein [Gordonia neofelifaecis NRRL B-59395]